jgi:transcriptional regulator with XRE-family HTH domain
MKISECLTDDAILAEIGTRIARRRLDLGLTQAQLAEQAGVAKRTLERVEAGASAQLSGMIRLFRVLDLLPGLDHMLPEGDARPMDLLLRNGRPRQRASSRRRKARSQTPWTWGDDT